MNNTINVCDYDYKEIALSIYYSIAIVIYICTLYALSSKIENLYNHIENNKNEIKKLNDTIENQHKKNNTIRKRKIIILYPYNYFHLFYTFLTKEDLLYHYFLLFFLALYL